MGILSPLVWPLYKSGAIVPIFGVLIIILGATFSYDFIINILLIIVGILLLIGGIFLVKEINKSKNQN